MPITAAAAAVILLIVIIRKKIIHGGSCCGEHERIAAKILPSDRSLSHYPYRYDALIEGMVCTNCARKAENAFNSNDGIYARVDLGNKTAVIFSKHELERSDAVKMLSGTGYTLIDLEERKK